MGGRSGITTGLEQLDEILGGLRSGDNVVWYDDGGSLSSPFVRHFLATAIDHDKEIVFVTFDLSPSAVLDRYPFLAVCGRCTLIDCFTFGRGSGAEVFTAFYKSRAQTTKCRVVKVQEPHNLPKVINAVFAATAGVASEARLVFDSLTSTERLWGGDDAVSEFYTACCPRLLELGALAYWLVDPGAHSARTFARINRTAQIVVDLTVKRGISSLTVVKSDERSTEHLDKARVFRVRDDQVLFPEPGQSGAALDIGQRIRALRTHAGLSQAELARAVGVTASTISQVESNQISPSLAALGRMIEVLGSDLGQFFQGIGPVRRIVYRGGEATEVRFPHLPPEFRVFSLVPADDRSRAVVYVIEIAPRARYEATIFRHAGEVLMYVLAGAPVVTVGGRAIPLTVGDVVRLTSDFPRSWENPGPEPARLHAVLVK